MSLLASLLALTVATTAPAPRIVDRPIPFGPARRAETARYAERHYGIDTWRLRDPHVIVEHYTATTSFAPVWATFAADTPDPELGELPGTCAHFVVDRDGTIYRLVPLGTARFQTDPGHSRVVTIDLTRAVRRLLTHRHTLLVLATLVVTPPRGRPQRRTATIPLRR